MMFYPQKSPLQAIVTVQYRGYEYGIWSLCAPTHVVCISLLGTMHLNTLLNRHRLSKHEWVPYKKEADRSCQP